jgi:hypothetical protein
MTFSAALTLIDFFNPDCGICASSGNSNINESGILRAPDTLE